MSEQERVEERPEVEKPGKGKDHMMDVGPRVISGELPCGYIDADGDLHRKFVVGEMSGEEEDLLAGSGPVMARLNRVIANCTQQLGSVTESSALFRAACELTAPDRMLMLITIRRASIDDHFDFEVRCPNRRCQQSDKKTVNLAELEITPMPDPMVRSFETQVGPYMVRWHVQSAEDEEWLTTMVKKREDVTTLAILSRVSEINGEKLKRDTPRELRAAKRILKSMSSRHRNALRAMFREHEGDIDTQVEIECSSCGHRWKGEVEVADPSFFFPQGM